METRRENENLHTVIETLKQHTKNLQIEKDTEVEALSNQVMILVVKISTHLHFLYILGFLSDGTSGKHPEPAISPHSRGKQKVNFGKNSSSNSG